MQYKRSKREYKKIPASAYIFFFSLARAVFLQTLNETMQLHICSLIIYFRLMFVALESLELRVIHFSIIVLFPVFFNWHSDLRVRVRM
jgi:hypothetical protein